MGDAGRVVLSLEGDAVGAVLGAGASPGRHHHATITADGSGGFGDHELAGRDGQLWEEQAAARFGGVGVTGQDC